jgi:hypothetical protein
MISLAQALDALGAPLPGVIRISDTVNVMEFDGAGEETQVVPAGAKYVLIDVSGQADVYVSTSGTAEVPAGDVTDGSASALAPELRQIGGATHISVAAAAACSVTLAYYG